MRLPRDRGFNEAGADCPGMHGGNLSDISVDLSFNEAGADCPGMPWRCATLHARVRASMRPGQTAPECLSPPLAII